MHSAFFFCQFCKFVRASAIVKIPYTLSSELVLTDFKSFPFSDVLLPVSQAFVFLLISPSINTSAAVMFCGQTNAPYRIYIRVIGELADPRGIRH